MLWYTVHSVVYTCDLILARIWLLGLCSFINRVLQSGIRAVSTVGRSLDRTGRVLELLLSNPCLLKLFYYYTTWILCLLTVLPWSFCCIYVWLDPGTYMIARFMFFYKPGVTTYRAPVVVGPGVLQHLCSCPAELAQALSAVHPLLVKCRSTRRETTRQSVSFIRNKEACKTV